MWFSHAPVFGLLLSLWCLSFFVVHTESMSASEVWKDKWHHMFRYFVPEQDGLYSMAYNDELSQIFQRLYPDSNKAKAEDIFAATNLVVHAVQALYGKDKLGVNENEYVNAIAYYFETEHTSFVGHFLAYYNAVFDVMDVNEDDTISLEEFKGYYLRRRVTDKKAENKLAMSKFKLLDANADGELSRGEYVGAYMAYVSDNSVTHDQLPLF